MIGKRRFLAVYLLLAVTGLFLQLHRDAGVPIKRPFEGFPTVVSRWRMAREIQLSEEVQSVLKASDVLLRQYVNERGDNVELYIGYHDGGRNSGEIHSPKHCLPGSGWLEISTTRTELPAAGGRVKLVRAIYQKGESKQLFLYWYQVRGRTVSEEYSLKAAEITNSLLLGRHDASFIRVSVPFEGDERTAASLAEGFVRDFLPAIHEYLPS